MIAYVTCDPIALVADIPDQAREWRNNPKIWQWCRQNSLLSLGDHEHWLAVIEADPSIKMFGIEMRSEKGRYPVGVCGFTSIREPVGSAEFSLYIGPEHQRKGYATKALRALLQHGFADLGLLTIWGEVFEGNPAADIFKDVGITHEGWLRNRYFKGGKLINSEMISITRQEWDEIENKRLKAVK